MKPEELLQFDGPDDNAIADPELMWRRIQRFWIVRDEAINGTRLSSEAFNESKKPLGPCSLIRSSQSTALHVQKKPDNSVGAILPSVIRANGFKLVSAPIDGDPGHYNMVGMTDKATRIRLADACTTVLGQPWGPDIPMPAPPPPVAPPNQVNGV